jgi:hypothetical protein
MASATRRGGQVPAAQQIGHLQPGALGAALLAFRALRSCAGLRSLLALLRLALTLRCGVARRWLAGVPRVLARLALQLGHSRLEPLVHVAQRLDELGLGRHQRRQLGDAGLVSLDPGGIVSHISTFATASRYPCLSAETSSQPPHQGSGT